MPTRKEHYQGEKRKKLANQVQEICKKHADDSAIELIRKIQQVYLFESPLELLWYLNCQGNGAISSNQKFAGCHIIALVNILKDRHRRLFESMAETIAAIAHKLPSNPYNIREVLEKISHSIDSGDTEEIEAGMSVAHMYLFRDNSAAPYIYRQEDLDDAKEVGYEEGYRTAIAVTEKAKITRNIDLNE